MPIKRYQCMKCHHEFDYFHQRLDGLPPPCPGCEHNFCQRIWSDGGRALIKDGDGTHLRG